LLELVVQTEIESYEIRQRADHWHETGFQLLTALAPSLVGKRVFETAVGRILLARGRVHIETESNTASEPHCSPDSQTY
jgi:hypothetical protein